MTIAKRQRAKLKAIRLWLKRNRHRSVAEQGRRLAAIVTGTVNYFGVPSNGYALHAFRTEVCKAWMWALRRRSQKGRNFNWARFTRLVARWIPSVKIVHPYPSERLHV